MSLVDRLLRPLRPTAVAGYLPPPRPIAEDLWTFERRLRFPLGLVLSGNMTVVRLGDGSLVVVSPQTLDATTRRQVDALGPVGAVIAPNSFHYLFAAEWARAFPGCRTYLAPGLRTRVDRCPAGIELTDAERPSWGAELDHRVVGPAPDATEVVLLHRPTATLILTDLAMNVTTIEPALQRWVWRASGIAPHFGPSRSARLTLLRDRAVAASDLAALLRWEFDRIVVAHGDVIERDGTRVFTDAFRDFLH